MLFGLGGILFLASIIFWVWAFFDCVTADARGIRLLPKWAWLVVLLFLGPYFGGALWLMIGRPRGARLAPVRPSGSAPSGFAPRPQRSRGPVGPDDDPEFLKTL